MENKIYPCYGGYSRANKECLACPVKTYCPEAKTAAGKRRYRERTSAEVAAAFEQYAEAPTVYETPEGKTVPGWKALLKVVVFLTSLHPTTLAILKQKIQNPEWQRQEAARMLGIHPDTVTNRVCTRRPVAAMFYTPRKENSPMSKTISAADHVYLSGPMSGLPELNAPAFHEAEERIQERYSCNVINPAFTGHLMGFDRTHENYMEVSLALVRTSSAVVMLPGWENSPGAKAERAEAESRGIPVFELAAVVK